MDDTSFGGASASAVMRVLNARVTAQSIVDMLIETSSRDGQM